MVNLLPMHKGITSTKEPKLEFVLCQQYLRERSKQPEIAHDQALVEWHFRSQMGDHVI
eukprot:m.117295 g.117295  ORF g.117295 m.117295 type:complete len:58 (+) comp15422_c0_seq1:948-1121(+)